MTYPSQARRMGIEGRVFVQFVVDKDGSVTEVKAVKGIGAGCDQEAERVLKTSPKWTPGKAAREKCEGENGAAHHLQVEQLIKIFFLREARYKHYDELFLCLEINRYEKYNLSLNFQRCFVSVITVFK